MAGETSPFGIYLRNQRARANLSLREVARALGVSHVYLGEVERGVRGPVSRNRWEALVSAIPGVTMQDLDRNAALSNGVQLELADAPPQYQKLGLVLARRIRETSIPDEELGELLRLLGEDE